MLPSPAVQKEPNRRPVLSITTEEYCECCGETLCSAECTFFQREFEAASRHSTNNANSVRLEQADPADSNPHDVIQDATVELRDGLPTRQPLHRTKSCGVHTLGFDQDRFAQRNKSFGLRQSKAHSRMDQIQDLVGKADITDTSC